MYGFIHYNVIAQFHSFAACKCSQIVVARWRGSPKVRGPASAEGRTLQVGLSPCCWCLLSCWMHLQAWLLVTAALVS